MHTEAQITYFNIQCVHLLNLYTNKSPAVIISMIS